MCKGLQHVGEQPRGAPGPAGAGGALLSKAAWTAPSGRPAVRPGPPRVSYLASELASQRIMGRIMLTSQGWPRVAQWRVRLDVKRLAHPVFLDGALAPSKPRASAGLGGPFRETGRSKLLSRGARLTPSLESGALLFWLRSEHVTSGGCRGGQGKGRSCSVPRRRSPADTSHVPRATHSPELDHDTRICSTQNHKQKTSGRTTARGRPQVRMTDA